MTFLDHFYKITQVNISRPFMLKHMIALLGQFCGIDTITFPKLPSGKSLHVKVTLH